MSDLSIARERLKSLRMSEASQYLPTLVKEAEMHDKSYLGFFVKADDKIPNIAGIKFPTYNRTIVSTRGAMVHDYERGIFHDQRDV